MQDTPDTTKKMSAEDCWARLQANNLGRLVLTDGNFVDVLPVLYGVADHEIYLLTTRGDRFSAVVMSRRVSFEIDEELENGIRSVIVQGVAHWLPPEMTPPLVPAFVVAQAESVHERRSHFGRQPVRHALQDHGSDAVL